MVPGSDWTLSWKLEPDMKAPIAEVVFEYNDLDRPLLSGSIALVCEEGRVDFGQVSIKPNG